MLYGIWLSVEEISTSAPLSGFERTDRFPSSWIPVCIPLLMKGNFLPIGRFECPYRRILQFFCMISFIYYIIFLQRYEDLWLCHVASYNYLLRLPILTRFLHVINAETDSKFGAIVSEIAKNHFLKLKLLAPSIKMEMRSKMDKNRLPPHFYPLHDEKTQSAFYDAHVTSSGQAAIPPALLHEGRLIRRWYNWWWNEYWINIQTKEYVKANFAFFIYI